MPRRIDRIQLSCLPLSHQVRESFCHWSQSSRASLGCLLARCARSKVRGQLGIDQKLTTIIVPFQDCLTICGASLDSWRIAHCRCQQLAARHSKVGYWGYYAQSLQVVQSEGPLESSFSAPRWTCRLCAREISPSLRESGWSLFGLACLWLLQSHLQRQVARFHL